MSTDTLTENEVITIRQGRATQSPYFHIIQPVPGIEFTAGQPVKCVNPKTGTITNAIVTEHHWTIDWDEMDMWMRVKILEIYGLEPYILRTSLIRSDPAFEDPWARIIMLKETN